MGFASAPLRAARHGQVGNDVLYGLLPTCPSAGVRSSHAASIVDLNGVISIGCDEKC
ncbi:MAG: hypothetical protein R2795_09785 [Saprospiraceae bacterium]